MAGAVARVCAASSALACLRAAVAASLFRRRSATSACRKPTWRVLKGAHVQPAARVWLPLLVLTREDGGALEAEGHTCARDTYAADGGPRGRGAETRTKCARSRGSQTRFSTV